MKNATGARETQLGKRGCSIRPGPGVYSGGGQGMKKTFFFSGKERRRRKEKAGRKLQTAAEGKAPHGKRRGGRADKEQTAAEAREGGRHWPLSRRRRRNSRPRASKNPRRRTTGNEDRLSRQQEGEEQLTVHRDLWLLLRSNVVEREPPRNICSTWKHSNNIRIMRRILHTPANVAQLLATCSYLFFRVFRT